MGKNAFAVRGVRPPVGHRRWTLAAAVSAAALGGCGLIVGDPHGTFVFPIDSGAVDSSVPTDSASATDSTFATDARAEADAGSALDSSPAGDTGIADAGHPVDTGGTDGPPTCPGNAGPMSIVVASQQTTYCIDVTEVTNAQYTAFLNVITAGAAAPPPGCEMQTDYTPATTQGAFAWPYAPGTDNHPVQNVNWCQAYAYCQWAGKRMCGQIGGDPVAVSDAQNPAVSQWFNACSSNGTLVYPYGNTFESGACGGAEAGAPVENVGLPTQCVGGVPGLYNMSGNVWEWIDSCDSTDPSAFCHGVGGAYDSTSSELECTSMRAWTRTAAALNFGIRCCGDL